MFLEIEATTTTLQAENGVRQQDYKRYRAFCTKQIHKNLKKVKLLILFHTSISKVPASESPLLIQNLLFQSQRAFAYGLQLKQLTPEFPRKHHHAVQRFRKAAKHAQQLLSVVVNCKLFDPRSLLEVEAYCNYIRSQAFFHTNSKWQEALKSLQVARSMYQMLIDTLPATSNISQLYANKISELNPQIRYCLHNLKLDESMWQVSLKSEYEAATRNLLPEVQEYLKNKDLHHQIGQAIQIQMTDGFSLEISDPDLIRTSKAAASQNARSGNTKLPLNVRIDAGKQGLQSYMNAVRSVDKLITQNPDLQEGYLKIKAAYAVSHAALYTEMAYLTAEPFEQPLQLPPKPQVVPSKPQFFDVALEFITSDNIKIGSAAKPSEQGGLLNKVLGGWFQK